RCARWHRHRRGGGRRPPDPHHRHAHGRRRRAAPRGRGDAALRGGDAMTTYAILPVKHFERAEQRLGGTLSDGSRWALAEAMVTDVLVALRRDKGVAPVLMVTSD